MITDTHNRNRPLSAQRDHRISLMPLECECEPPRWIKRTIMIVATVIGMTLGAFFPPF